MKKVLAILGLGLSIIWTASAQTPATTINGVPPPYNFTGAGVSQTGQTFTFSGGTGSGTVESGTVGQLGWYPASGTAIAGNPIKTDQYGTNFAFPLLPDPTVAPSAALAGLGAGNVDNGLHDYAMVCVTAAGTTSAGPVATATVVDKTTNGQVALTSIPSCGGPAGQVTGKQLYRTKAGLDCTPNDGGDTSVTGCVFYALGTVLSPSATSYTDNIADASLGATAIPNFNTTSGALMAGGSVAAYATTFGGAPVVAFDGRTSSFGLYDPQMDGAGMNFSTLEGVVFGQSLIHGPGTDGLFFQGIGTNGYPGISMEADVAESSVTDFPAYSLSALKSGDNPGDPSQPLGAGDMLFGINSVGGSTYAFLLYGDGRGVFNGGVQATDFTDTNNKSVPVLATDTNGKLIPGTIQGTISTGPFLFGSSAVNTVVAQTTASQAGHFTNLAITSSLGGSCTTSPTFNVFDGTTNTGTAKLATSTTQTKGVSTTQAQTLTFAAGDLIGIYISVAGATCTTDTWVVSAQYSTP